MKKLRIVFMGTPEFAVPSLSALATSPHKVVGVVTTPDRPSGRGKKMTASAVKMAAMKLKLPILQPENLKDSSCLEALKSLNPDLFVVVAFRMLPKVVWSIPSLGTFNLHASLLPKFRGAAPIHWAIVHGESKTGLTTFMIDENIDTGHILLQKSIEIEPEINTGVLHNRLMEMGGELVLETVNGLANNSLTPMPQPLSENFEIAPKLSKANTQIDWSLKGEQIVNFIRGMAPYPGAWCFWKWGEEEKVVKIFEASFNAEAHDKKNGQTTIQNKTVEVYCNDGIIQILSLQLAGKKIMSTKDFLNGHSPPESSIME